MKHNGFTLIELLIVVALIMILSSIGVGAFTTSTLKSRDTQRKNDLNQMAKALESFNNDVGRYPTANEAQEAVCFEVVSNVGADIPCQNDKLVFKVDGSITNYIVVPKDPDSAQKYIYSSDGASYSLYTALQNVSDKDLLRDGEGLVINNPFGVYCGDTPCNYRITEVGLSKSL